MSAYRAAPAERPEDVRELTMHTVGAFGVAVWTGFVVVAGVAIAAAVWGGARPDYDLAGALRTIFAVTLAAAALVAALVALLDERLRFVVRVGTGVLEVSRGRALRRAQARSFALRDVTRFAVDEHGEDHVAVFVHAGAKATPVFVTVHGDDARRVEAFLDEGLHAWREGGVEP